MNCQPYCNYSVYFLSIFLLTTSAAIAESTKTPADAAQPVPQAPIAYKEKFEEYTTARRKFDDEVAAYWKLIDEKKQNRNEKRRNGQEVLLEDYVLIQPPTYSGPARPVDPSAAPKANGVPGKKYVPVVADFLKFAAEHFQFVPERPANEIEFKRIYAEAASAAGLTKDQVVGVYGFETGGTGKYDVQAGLGNAKAGEQAISTALGYNQLLSANTVSLLAQQGDHFIRELRKKAGGLTGERRQSFDEKIEILHRMIAFCRTVPNKWSEHLRLAATPQGLGTHALNLDVYVGPLLQTQKLLNSVILARRKGHNSPLSAAEVEMMNLSGDGNGFDMLTMPLELRNQIPTSNFFQQDGYERNPIARRNNLVSKLFAATEGKMQHHVTLEGAEDLAAAF